MLKDAFRDMGDRVYIQSRHNADLFTVTYFRDKKNTNILVTERLLAVDSELIAHSAEEIQRIVDTFTNGQKINIKKTQK